MIFAGLTLLATVVLALMMNEKQLGRLPRLAWPRPLTGFAVWGVAGFVSAAALLTLAAVGMFLLPLAAIAVFVSVRKPPSAFPRSARLRASDSPSSRWDPQSWNATLSERAILIRLGPARTGSNVVGLRLPHG